MNNANISLHNIFSVKENFYPERKCFKYEQECENSYGYKICVQEKYKVVACATYNSKTFCDDHTILYKFFGKIR